MKTTALLSFIKNSINTRLLAAYLKSKGAPVICVFCEEEFNPCNLGALITLLKRQGVGLVGVSLVTDDFRKAVTVTGAVSGSLGVPVIWGGAHVNCLPLESLRYADMVCLGEGEEALFELVRSLSRGNAPDTSIANIWFRSQERIIRNDMRQLEENLDSLPYADTDAHTQYMMTADGVVLFDAATVRDYSVMTSRGCPYSCRYCYNNYRRKHYQGKGAFVRARSIENVIGELALARSLYPRLSRVCFMDDSFLIRSPDDFRLFSRLYRERVNLPFFILVEPMAFDEEKVRLLKDAGLASIQVGIQTGSDRVNRDIYDRRVSADRVLAVARAIGRLGLQAHYDIIFNNPYETQADIIQTIRLLMRFPKPFSLQGFNLIFYPGTELTDQALAEGYISARSAADDFTTIQGSCNTPLGPAAASEVSSRFYAARYDSRGKEYLNSLFPMLGSAYIPHAFIEFLIAARAWFPRPLMKAMVQIYRLALALRNSSRGTGT